MVFISIQHYVKAVLLLHVVTEKGDLHLNVAEGAWEVLPPLIISCIFNKGVWVSAKKISKFTVVLYNNFSGV